MSPNFMTLENDRRSFEKQSKVTMSFESRLGDLEIHSFAFLVSNVGTTIHNFWPVVGRGGDLSRSGT